MSTAVLSALPPIFRDVLDSEVSVRYDLASPWREGGYVYATDGRVLVRMPLDNIDPDVREMIPGRDDQAHGRRPGDPGSKFTEYGPHATVAVALPDTSPGEPCPECGGFGGEVIYEGPPLEFFPCQFCEGDLVLLSTEPIPLGTLVDGEPYHVAEWMVGLLAKHKAQVYLPIDLTSGLCRHAAMRFTIGRSVEGMAMPLSVAARRA